MPQKTFRIALIGSHEPDYPRNQAIRKTLLQAGHEVFECHSRSKFPRRYWDLARQFLNIHPRVDFAFVTEGGHRLVPLVRMLAAAMGTTVVFDPFISRYSTRIEDRKLHSKFSLQAVACLWQDWSSTHAAHALIFDTHEHQEYFDSLYGLDKPFAIVPVGAEETIFRPSIKAVGGIDASPDVFTALFYGTYIPLQGIEHILEAAALLKSSAPHVRFTLVGNGQTFEDMKRHALRLNLTNVDFNAPVPTAELPALIATADVCLGIFGKTKKAANVVPNKVVQAAAMGTAIITADTPAVRRYFTPEVDVTLVPPGDAQSLAAAIVSLALDPSKRNSLKAGSRRAFERWFSQDRQSKLLQDFLTRLDEP